MKQIFDYIGSQVAPFMREVVIFRIFDNSQYDRRQLLIKISIRTS